MNFPLGKPILAMFAAALLCGGALIFLPRTRASNLTLWVFADSHARTYRTIQDRFEHATGKSLAIDDVGDSINIRLSSLFMAGRTGSALPDAVEIEIGNIGRFFRPPVSDVGFLPLNHYLESSGLRTIDSPGDPGQPGWNARCTADGKIYTFDRGHWAVNPSRQNPDSWIDRIIPARFAPWSKEGVIFGVPHDVHPVSLTYRDDLFRQAGIDLGAARTWLEFQEMCFAFQSYWRGKGLPHRHAMQLSASASDDLVIMLLQRHVNVVDDRGQIHLADEAVVKTLAFYAQLVAGTRSIGGQTEGNTGLWVSELERGDICVFWTPDWKTDLLRRYGHTEALAGKLRMMPLPRFDPQDTPTSTWGGTMIGIPRGCTNPDEAWKLIEFLYFSDAGIEARRKEGDIVSPIMERWNDPMNQEPDPLFGGQKVRRLYIDLARQIPPRYVTPITTVAQITLSIVLGYAVDHVRKHGAAGLEDQCRRWLNEAAADVRRRVEHASFEPQDVPQ